MAKKLPRPPLGLLDYQRVFRTIHGVLLNERSDPPRACLYFGIIGAAILQKHHRLPARPVVGAAAYRFEQAGEKPLVFATPCDGGLGSGENGFHCWVESDGWVIDFQAPLFREMLVSHGLPPALPRKMFQKRCQGASSGPDEMKSDGAYWFAPNPDLQDRLFRSFASLPANKDFVDICCDWYVPMPKKIRPSIGIGNQRNEIANVPLSAIAVDGVW